MLTATYSLVALSVEQKNTRSILCKLQQQIDLLLHDLQGANRSCIEAVFSKLEQFEAYCHRRKMETHVIPAIRKTTRQVDGILSELESISSAAVGILQSLQQQLRHAIDQGTVEIQRLRTAMELYCHNLLKRLAKEEEELFPIVRNLLPVEQWFEIAAKFLSEDTGQNRKSASPALR